MRPGAAIAFLRFLACGLVANCAVPTGPRTFIAHMYATLNRGANERCAYGAADGLVRCFPPMRERQELRMDGAPEDR